MVLPEECMETTLDGLDSIFHVDVTVDVAASSMRIDKGSALMTNPEKHSHAQQAPIRWWLFPVIDKRTHDEGGGVLSKLSVGVCCY